MGTGLVASLARPGGNTTGLSAMGADTAGKPLNLRLTEYNGSTKVSSAAATVTLSTTWQQVTVTYTVATGGTTLG